MLRHFAAALTLGAGLLASAASHAGTYQVVVTEGLSNGSGFQTTNSTPYNPFGSNVAGAIFTYNGSLNFSDTQGQNTGPSGDLNSTFGFSSSNVSNYSGFGTVTQGVTNIANYTSLSGFLGSSGSAGRYQYGSWYGIDLGVLAAGTTLTITHDDGAAVYQGSTQIGPTVQGPTTQTTDVLALGTTADTMLYYSRQNGTPSILQVTVPEPGSVTMFVAGLLGLTMVARRRRRA